MSDTGGQFENPFASPQSEEAPVVSNPTPAWRDGELVVVAPDGELPRRCAKCGGEASGKSLHTDVDALKHPWRAFLIWLIVSPPVFYGLPIWFRFFPATGRHSTYLLFLFAFFQLCVFAFVTYGKWVKRDRVLRYHYCPRHAKQLFAAGITMLVLILGIMLVVILGLLYEAITNSADQLGVLFIGVAICLPGLVLYPATYFPVVKRTSGRVWLRGFGKPFVDSLPPYDESAEASSAANEQEH